MNTIFFDQFVDPHAPQGRHRYDFAPFLARLCLALLAQGDSLRSMVRWMATHHGDLNRALGTDWETSPTRTACAKLLTHLKNGVTVKPETSGDHVGPVLLHVDGKALRGSGTRGGKMRYLTSVLRDHDGLVLAKSHHTQGGELDAARDALLRLKESGVADGAWITFDALHIQKKH